MYIKLSEEEVIEAIEDWVTMKMNGEVPIEVLLWSAERSVTVETDPAMFIYPGKANV